MPTGRMTSMTRASLEKQPHEVATMFDDVAAKYDLTNDVLTAGIDPATGELAGESAGEQAAQALKNIKHILDTAGSGIENVCRATIYMKNVEDFHEVDDVYAKVFIGSVKPARVAFGGNDIPKGALVEIDAIAAL